MCSLHGSVVAHHVLHGVSFDDSSDDSRGHFPWSDLRVHRLPSVILPHLPLSSAIVVVLFHLEVLLVHARVVDFTWEETTHHELVPVLPCLALEVGIKDLDFGAEVVTSPFLHAVFWSGWITWNRFHDLCSLSFILCFETPSVHFHVVFPSPVFGLITDACSSTESSPELFA